MARFPTFMVLPALIAPMAGAQLNPAVLCAVGQQAPVLGPGWIITDIPTPPIAAGGFILAGLLVRPVDGSSPAAPLLLRWPLTPAGPGGVGGGVGAPVALASPDATLSLPGFEGRTTNSASWPSLRLDDQGRALATLTSTASDGTTTAAWLFGNPPTTPNTPNVPSSATALMTINQPDPTGTMGVVSLTGSGALADASALSAARVAILAQVQPIAGGSGGGGGAPPQETIWAGQLTASPVLQLWTSSGSAPNWLTPSGSILGARRLWTGGPPHTGAGAGVGVGVGVLGLLARDPATSASALVFGTGPGFSHTLASTGQIVAWPPADRGFSSARIGPIVHVALGASVAAFVGSAFPGSETIGTSALWITSLAPPSTNATPNATPRCRIITGLPIAPTAALGAVGAVGAVTIIALGPPAILPGDAGPPTVVLGVRYTRAPTGAEGVGAGVVVATGLLRVAVIGDVNVGVELLASSEQPLIINGSTASIVGVVPDLSVLLSSTASLHVGGTTASPHIAPTIVWVGPTTDLQRTPITASTLVRLTPGPAGAGMSAARAELALRVGQSVTFEGIGVGVGVGTIDQIALAPGSSSPGDGRPSPFAADGSLAVLVRAILPVGGGGGGVGFRHGVLHIPANPSTPTTPTAPCGVADVASPGPVAGPDGELTADDVILFITWFAGVEGDARADIAGPGPSAGADGERTADDVIFFINRFVAGC